MKKIMSPRGELSRVEDLACQIIVKDFELEAINEEQAQAQERIKDLERTMQQMGCSSSAEVMAFNQERKMKNLSPTSFEGKLLPDDEFTEEKGEVAQAQV